MQTRTLQKKLLNWYTKNSRALPWRATKDPYAIWVSEIMLQQTQVQTVIPYYERWMRTFPTLRSLAESSEDQVLKRWEGLGYYSRARNLRKAAKKILLEQDGHFPKNFDAILALPGIGRYTAGAITSIAFGLPYPVLDANVIRVLSRVYAVNQSLALSSTLKKLWDLATQLLPHKNPGDFNQAMMELGASLCSPKKPSCLLCPLRDQCLAYSLGNPEAFPVKAPKIKTEKINVAIGMLWDRKKVLIQKRSPTGLWAGLWEFPGGKVEAGETPEQGLLREMREELGVQIKICQKRKVILHTYTRFRVTLHPFDCILKTGTPKNKAATELKWVPVERLPEYAFPSANGKLIPHLIQAPWG
jgi:A/G-specific adenine glycosylase